MYTYSLPPSCFFTSGWRAHGVFIARKGLNRIRAHGVFIARKGLNRISGLPSSHMIRVLTGPTRRWGAGLAGWPQSWSSLPLPRFGAHVRPRPRSSCGGRRLRCSLFLAR